MKNRYVKRLTRSLLTQLNSPQSHRFISFTTTTKSPLRHHQTTLISTRSIHSPLKFLQITTFVTKSGSTADAADEHRREDDNKHDVASERKEAPHEFSRNVEVLTCESQAEGGKCVVYLVGTAHISQASCREVEAVIRHVKPQVVFLELCASRVGLLTIRSLKVPTMEEMIEKWKKTQNAPQIFLSWFYATVGDKIGVVPGSEFQVAFEEARKCEAKVVLGDRPAQITFRRTQGKFPFWHKVKFLCSVFVQILFSSSSKSIDTMIKDLDDVKKVTSSTKKLSKQFPTIMQTLVDERDQYMSSILLRIAKEHTSVVAVIGKGHLQGIKKYWEQPIQLKDLLDLPPQKPPFSALKVLAVAGMAIGSAFIFRARNS
ncbi:TRAB FAMILY PROTEIN [Salix purpurea]|uniref:TRAB FAMILY PROTEIN n=1 Tax=Salix purpurea TaxID=77065 RepID=A0A9Q0ZNI9_SALPP|nr:TRAB FAMILY PROTEIN [Salix purpurea]